MIKLKGFSNKIKLKIIGLIFFFANSIGLPTPLLYINFFALARYKDLFKSKNKVIFIWFFIISSIYFLIHLYLGVSLKDYLKTFLFIQIMMFSTLISYNYIIKNKGLMPNLFSFIAKCSIGLYLVAIASLFTPLKDYLWIIHDFSLNSNILRYKAFTYEPSFYALLFSPLVIYFFLKVMYSSFKRYILRLTFVLVPIFSTLSFGFIGVLFVAWILFMTVLLAKYKTINRNFIIPIIAVITLALATISFENPVSNRINVFLNGEDTSVNGRIINSYYLANEMTKDKSQIFGIGLGQIKILGEKHIRSFYGYSKEEWPVMALPNATAETLAIYGYLGLLIRITIQIVLFFKFRVYNNYFNLFMFLFIFTYQLMGSFITSTVELVLWVLAIAPVFKSLDIRTKKSL